MSVAKKAAKKAPTGKKNPKMPFGKDKMMNKKAPEISEKEVGPREKPMAKPFGSKAKTKKSVRNIGRR